MTARGWARTLFFCVRWEKRDGHDFAQQVVAGGGGALVVGRELGVGVPQAVVATRGRPCSGCGAVRGDRRRGAVAGGRRPRDDNGKTTSRLLLRPSLEALGRSAGLAVFPGRSSGHAGAPATSPSDPPRTAPQPDHGRPRVGDHGLRHPHPQLPLDHQSRRPAATTCWREVVPIPLLPRTQKKSDPGPTRGLSKQDPRSLRRIANDRARQPSREARPVSRHAGSLGRGSGAHAHAQALIPAAHRDKEEANCGRFRRKPSRTEPPRFSPCGWVDDHRASSCGFCAGAKPMNEATYLVPSSRRLRRPGRCRSCRRACSRGR